MTQRIVLFSVWLKELKMTQRIEPFLFQYDSKKCIYFLNMTQRIEHFLDNDSNNSTFFQYDSKNWTHFLNMFQWIEPFASRCDSRSWTLFLKRRHDSKNWSFYEYDAKSWTLLRIWLKELSPFFSVTERIEPYFEHVSMNLNPFFKTQRIELFFFKMTQKKCHL